MAIEGDLQTLLATLVSSRCYPVINTSATIVKPYITYQVVGGPALNDLDGATGTKNKHIQIDVWADTYGAAKTLAAQIEAAMKTASFVNVPSMEPMDLYDEVSKEFRVLMEFSIWS